MADLKEVRLKKTMEIESKTLWDCHKHDYGYEEHIEECLSEMLSAYIGDDRNYAVDGAEIECIEMCKISHCIKYENGKTKLCNVLNAPKAIERDYIPPGKEEGKPFILEENLIWIKSGDYSHCMQRERLITGSVLGQ